MKCEYCEQEHDGSYASGRFCNKKCSRGFCTKAKRKEINEKVSKSLKGRESWSDGGFKEGHDPNRFIFTKEVHDKTIETQRINREEANKLLSTEELSKGPRKQRVLEEQNYTCECGLGIEWKGKSITLELHHIDCNPKNNKRENLTILCPNCHSQTDGFRNRI